VEALESGENLDVDRLVSADRRQRIAEVMRELGLPPLGEVMEQLGEGYDYNELRVVRALMARP
jgi:ATP-dependent DNA helicase RecQ